MTTIKPQRNWLGTILAIIEKFLGIRRSKKTRLKPILEMLQGRVANAHRYDVSGVPTAVNGINIVISWSLVAAIANTRVQITVLDGARHLRLNSGVGVSGAGNLGGTPDYLVIFRRYDYGHNSGVMRHTSTCVCGWVCPSHYMLNAMRYMAADVKLLVQHLINTGVLREDFCKVATARAKFGSFIPVPPEAIANVNFE